MINPNQITGITSDKQRTCSVLLSFLMASILLIAYQWGITGTDDQIIDKVIFFIICYLFVFQITKRLYDDPSFQVGNNDCIFHLFHALSHHIFLILLFLLLILLQSVQTSLHATTYLITNLFDRLQFFFYFRYFSI